LKHLFFGKGADNFLDRWLVNFAYIKHCKQHMPFLQSINECKIQEALGTKQIREEPSQIKQSRLAYNRRGLEMCMDKIHLATLKRHVAFLFAFY